MSSIAQLEKDLFIHLHELEQYLGQDKRKNRVSKKHVYTSIAIRKRKIFGSVLFSLVQNEQTKQSLRDCCVKTLTIDLDSPIATKVSKIERFLGKRNTHPTHQLMAQMLRSLIQHYKIY